jgi:hypothetical protein
MSRRKKLFLLGKPLFRGFFGGEGGERMGKESSQREEAKVVETRYDVLSMQFETLGCNTENQKTYFEGSVEMYPFGIPLGSGTRYHIRAQIQNEVITEKFWGIPLDEKIVTTFETTIYDGGPNGVYFEVVLVDAGPLTKYQ